MIGVSALRPFLALASLRRRLRRVSSGAPAKSGRTRRRFPAPSWFLTLVEAPLRVPAFSGLRLKGRQSMSLILRGLRLKSRFPLERKGLDSCSLRRNPTWFEWSE